MRAIALALASLVLVAGCQTTEPLPPAAQEFDYTAFNAAGQPVVTGTLSLLQSGEVVEGRWQLAAADGAAFPDTGPQVGEGPLTGTATDKLIILNLNPGTMDNHVILRGRLRNGLLSGWWQYVGFGGVVSEGAFSAVAK